MGRNIFDTSHFQLFDEVNNVRGDPHKLFVESELTNIILVESVSEHIRPILENLETPLPQYINRVVNSIMQNSDKKTQLKELEREFDKRYDEYYNEANNMMGEKEQEILRSYSTGKKQKLQYELDSLIRSQELFNSRYKKQKQSFDAKFPELSKSINKIDLAKIKEKEYKNYTHHHKKNNILRVNAIERISSFYNL
ncbi:MAG: hypothetical protein ACQESC_03630 [Nanobdellota archaeon]